MTLYMVVLPSAIASQVQLTSSVCDYFPSAAQTWSNLGKLTINGSAIIENAHQGKYVGFASNKITATQTSCASTQGENITKCLSDTDLMVPEYPWENSPPWLYPITSPAHEIRNGDMIVFPGEYLSLPYDNQHTTGKYIFEAGSYWIQHTMLSGAEILEFPDDKVVLNVDSFSVSGNVVINTSGDPDNLELVAHTLNGMISLSSNNFFNALIVSRSSILLSGNVEIRGAVTTKNLVMNGYAKIIAQSDCFNPVSNLKLFISPTLDKGIACDGIAIDFSLVDANNNVVTGKGQELAVTSLPLSDSGKKNACWSDDGSITIQECSKASDGEFSINFTAGQPATIRRYIHSKFLNSYNIDAYVVSENLNLSTGPYEFVAKSVSIIPSEGVNGSNSNQVAGRPFPFRLKIRGKKHENGNQLTCKIIDETRDVKVNFVHTKQPINSSEDLLISVNSGQSWQSADSNINVSFISGIAGGDINNADGSLLAKFSDAGIVDMTLTSTDPAKSLSASHRFYFRPFTMTVCDNQNSFPNNTTELDGAYIASGQDFNGVIKAVNWISLLDSNNNGIPDSHNADLVCKRPYTESYLTHSGYAASASLSASVIYPASGDLGLFNADNVPFNHYYKNITASNQHQTTLFNWNEVGSLQLGSFQNNYFNRSGFNIPPTLAQVGRFYPSYFRVTKTEWTYPTEQGSQAGSYIYMDQNFTDVDFEVTAYSILDSETTNYVFFDDSLKASFSLVDEDGYAERLNITDVDLNASHWNSGAVWHVNNLNHAVIWSKKEVTAIASTRTTEADGPFNKVGNSNSTTTELSLKIHGEDPVTFIKGSSIAEAELLAQPDVRYGRMVLDSVGSAVGRDVLVPLKVEYWNGNTFVLSDTDNASQFDGSKYCKKTVWPDPNKSSETQLEGKGTVNQGQNLTTLIADSNNSAQREQIRFWLRLASNSPQTSESHVSCESSPPLLEQQPWLQYNWRGLGDEDPSAIVTFGVYRGNDRIIFRGESNIIGTSN